MTARVQSTGGLANALRGSRRLYPLIPLVLFLAVFFILPVMQLLTQSLFDNSGAWTMQHYNRLFASSVYVNVLKTTFWFALWTTFLCIVFGYPVAYLLATHRASSRNILVLGVLIPFWTSFLVRTLAWVVLLGRNGAINNWLQALGITDAPLSMIYNATGVFIGLVHAMLPLAVLTMLSVMQTIDTRLVNASRTLGASGSQSFWRVYFPLSMPGVAAAGILVFVSTVGFFITPALLGGGKETTISQVIIDQINLLNWAFAGAIGVLLLAVTLASFFLYDRVFGLSSLAAGASTETKMSGLAGNLFGYVLRGFIEVMATLSSALGRLMPRSRKRRGDRPGWGRSAVALAVIAFLIVPSLFVVPISFSAGSFLEWPPQGFSLRWYQEFFSSSLWIGSIVRSVLVGLCSALLALAIGVPACLAIVWGPKSIRSGAIALALSPLIVPRIIIAVGLFYLYAKIGLVGTSLGLALGHAVLALPFVIITVTAVLKSYDVRLDNAARSLGASKLQTLWHVTLPVIKPGLVAAFLFAFVTSFDELTVALFVTGGLVTTLPKQMWDGALLNITPVVTAASTVSLILVTIVIVAAAKLQNLSKKTYRA